VAWRTRAWWAAYRNTDAYAAAPLAPIDRGMDLPGVLGPLLLLDAEDGRGGRQALIYNRATGIVSAILRVAPVGIALADQVEANSWVANYGGMLADLGYKSFVDAIMFVTETSPTGGVNLRSYTQSRIATDAPAVCRDTLTELVPRGASTTADVSATVTINFDPSQMTPVPTDLSDAVTEVVRWLPTFESALSNAGAPVLARATPGWLIRRVRACFDPAIRTDITGDEVESADEIDEVASWRDAGPLRSERSDDVYWTDSGYHASWCFEAPPSGTFRQTVLMPMLTPGPYYRRFALVYRPYSGEQAAKVVEDEVTSGRLRAIWARQTKKDETERDRRDRAKAAQAAKEESLGAGVGRLTAYVTTTVRRRENLDAACANVEQRISTSKLRFRRASGAQEAVFAVSLPLGVDPTKSLSRRASDRWDG
jgi:hypothetical protein